MRGTTAIALATALCVALVAPPALGQEATPTPSPSSTAEPSPSPSLAPSPSPSPSSSPPPGASSVTLRLSDRDLAYGTEVRLSGRVDPVVPEAVVRILNEDGSEVATAEPKTDGTYSVRVSPTHNLALRAYWLEARSGVESMKVRPIVRLSLRKVQLFGKATLRGRVAPASDSRVRLVLKRNGRTWKKWSFQGDGSFTKRVRITKLGRFKAKAVYQPDGLASGRRGTIVRRAPIPQNLTTGSKGGAVKRLEWRLRKLGYYIPRVNRSYGVDTRDAVIAFNKVQRRVRSGSVDSGVWQALASPRRAAPRHARGSHIEIDQTRQILMVVRKGKVKWILHTSTGAGGASRDGTWTVNRKIAGYSPGRLYYPSYYDGLRAVHGWPDVPTYPASHGCARVPMWSATWIHSKMPMGTTVYVYH